MLVLKSWLKEHIDFDLESDKLADLLSLSGTAVESYSKLDEKIIVAQIKEIAKHPNADKLQIAQVFTGSETLQIVCGAPNIVVGQIVPLAQIGTKFADFEIKKAEIRGVESFGMMCSDRELGLSDEHAGIKILDETYEIGQPLAKYIDLDTVFELETTANRGDELSHLGVAHEIAALQNKNITDIKQQEFFMPKNKDLFSVKIEAEKLCPQYTGILIENIKIEPSPEWLQKRLLAVGVKPINNIVDITNYIMFDCGQPMHAFDAAKINDKSIVVRESSENEKIIGLDSKEYILPAGSLVIADNQKPIAIAGIMGGENSQVDDTTKNIILESAEFDAVSVRATSKKINLSTEASYRFERKIDSGSVVLNALKAAKMISELAGGEIKEVVSVGEATERIKIKIDYDKINGLTGLGLVNDEIDQILVNLGFIIEASVAQVPLWRHDISLWQDLAEEVARIYGYDKIPRADIPASAEPENAGYYYKELIKDILVDCGFSEIFGYAFLSEQDLKVTGQTSAELLEVSNPIRPENKFLRSSLFSSLLKAVAKNPSFDPVMIFEIGHVFTKDDEKTYLGLAASGKNAKNEFTNAISKINEKLNINLDIEILELGRDELDRYKIRKPMTCIAEVDLSKVLEKVDLIKKNEPLQEATSQQKYKEVSKYPPVVRDLAFIVDQNVETCKIKQAIFNVSDNILLVDLFDEFSSAKFGENKKSLAYHIYLQELNRAMSDAEADVIFKQIIQKVSDEFKAELRS